MRGEDQFMPMEPDLPPRRRSIVPIVLLLIAALLIGMGGMAWLIHRFDYIANVVRPTPVVAVAAPVRQPVAAPQPAVPAAPSDALSPGADERIEAIEHRVDDIDTRATAASGRAARAEGLLIAFAARRVLDRGTALGYLEGLLRDRFGGVDPQAVASVISASHQPITVDQLRDQLDVLSPKLSKAAPDESWWDGFRRELGGLIVVRKAESPSEAPVDRLARARDDLAAGHVDSALVEVARLPAQQEAQGWIASARRYVQAHVALDRLETAALLQPASAAVTE